MLDDPNWLSQALLYHGTQGTWYLDVLPASLYSLMCNKHIIGFDVEGCPQSAQGIESDRLSIASTHVLVAGNSGASSCVDKKTLPSLAAATP